MNNRKFYFNNDNELVMEDHGSDLSVIYETFDKDDIIKIKNAIKEQSIKNDK